MGVGIIILKNIFNVQFLATLLLFSTVCYTSGRSTRPFERYENVKGDASLIDALHR